MNHDAFVKRAAQYFPGAKLVSEPTYEDYRRFALAHLERACGVGTKVQQYESSIDFLGQLARNRTGTARENALRLRDELHGLLTEYRRKKP